jgi:phosphatidylglycerol lysyltransferase
MHVGRVTFSHEVTIIGSRYVLLVSGLVLCAAAWSLLRGKRRGWQLAVLTLLLSLAVYPRRHVELLEFVPTMLTLACLGVTMRAFPARNDPVKASVGWWWLLLGEFGVLVYGTAGLWIFDRDFAHRNDLSASISSAVRLLFLQPVDTINTVSRHGDWFVASVRVLAAIVLFVALWHLVHPVIARSTSDRRERARARAILTTYATTGLAYFHLMPDKRLFIARDRRALLSYRVVGATAIVLGEPIGEPTAAAALVVEFVEFCDLHGWRVAFHQVSPAGAALLGRLGWKALKIGEEAIVPVQEFSLDGSHYKRLRNKNRQLLREGLVVEDLTSPADDDTMAELAEVSDAWRADGAHRERCFTLGWFDAAYLRETTVVVVRDVDGRILAFANLLPAFVGTDGNFDLMRRRPDAPNGVMDLLLCSLIERFRAEGCSGMTLGFAPLANIDGDGFIAKALRALYERDSRAFNFRGLHEYKSKWSPRWEPRYLVYRSDVELATIAYAIARVGERERDDAGSESPTSKRVAGAFRRRYVSAGRNANELPRVLATTCAAPTTLVRSGDVR